MLFLHALLFAGLAVASAIPASPVLEKRGTGVCTGADLVPPVQIGATSGPAFCESSWGGSYAPVTKLTVYSTDDFVTGIMVSYSDGTSSKVLGATSTYTRSSTVDYSKGATWSRVSMYGRVGAGYVLHLLLDTTSHSLSNSGAAVPGSTDPNLVRHDQTVGSGVLFGVKGTLNANGKLQSLSFLFLNSAIAAISVNNVQFPNGPLGTNQGIVPTSIGSSHFTDTSSDPVQYQFNNQLSEMQQYAYQQTYTTTFTTMEAIAFNFGFSLLIVTGGSSTTTFTWTSTQTYQTTATFTQAIQVQYNAQVTVQPGQVIDCNAVMGQGAGTFPYTSTVTITLKNGNKYSFAENGYLKVSSFSQGQVTCQNGK